MNILQFLRNKLVPIQTPVTPPEVKKVATSKEDSEMWRAYGITNEALRQVISDQNLIIYERSSVYQVVDRAMNHALMSAACVAFADTACLTGDTKIPLLDGRILTIKEIVDEYNFNKENWVYSCDLTGKPNAQKILDAFEKPNKKQVIRIHLDNDKYVDASVDHQFIRRDGTLCRADELTVGTSLMPFHRCQVDGYDRVYDVDKKVWEPTYKMVARTVLGTDTVQENKDKKIDSILDIHHKDFHKENNNPTNLQILLKLIHIKLHGDNVTNLWKQPEYRKMQSERATKANNNRWNNMTAEEKSAFGKNLAKIRKANGTSIAHNKLPRETRNCVRVGCGLPFECRVNDTQKYCSKECLHIDNPGSKARSEQAKSDRTTLICATCGNQFSVPPYKVVTAKYCSELCMLTGLHKGQGERNRQRKVDHQLVPSYNHKVINIESLGEQTVYDISIGGEHLFALDCGIYVHNCLRSPLHGSTVWVTSDNREYRYQLEKMLDVINIEEVIYDWAWTTAAFGDLFVEVFGEPGVGIVCINDDNHPINVSRVDHNGRLVGFFQTPLGYATSDTRKLLAPWDHVHFRLLGAKKRRPLYADQQYSEFRTISIMTPDARRLTSKYGTSVLADALPIWKRLRLAEDSIMMARIMKSPQRFLFKVVIPEDNANAEAVANLVDQYQTEIKRARAMNLDSNNPNYLDRFNAMACLVGDTKINLLDGTTPTIKELADYNDKYIGKYVLSVNPKTLQLEPKKVVAAQKTRLNAELVRVHLDNNQYIDCTPDHRFMLRDGTYKEAKDLVQDTSLMPLYNRISESKRNFGYKEVYNPASNKYELEHHIVQESIRGKNKEVAIHHKDFNKLNNDPVNLQDMIRRDHWKYHSSLGGQFTRKHKGETYEQMYGEDKANDIKRKQQKNSASKNRSGKTYEEIVGAEKANEWKESVTNGHIGIKYPNRKSIKQTKEHIDNVRKAIAELPDVDLLCPYCEKSFIGKSMFDISGHTTQCHKNPNNVHKYEIRKCQCSVECYETFECRKDSNQKFVNHEHYGKSKIGTHREQVVVNHKVVRVEWLTEHQDTYDIQVEDNHNFPLSVGVFVHNSAEDLIFPVWGSSENLTVETLGGETDIKWIADIDKLENQLITALKVPKQLLAGFSGEGGGGFEGGTALERMDIRFARQARRVQRSLISGLTRMAQIHLAYQGMDPDLNLFQVHMCETSSAEEVELQDGLGKSVEATRGLYDLLTELVGVDLNKKELLRYFNEKFFKLSDLNIDELYLKGDASAIVGDRRDLPVPGVETPVEEEGAGAPPIEGEEVPAEGAPVEGAPEEPTNNPFKESLLISDLKSPLPNSPSGKLWESNWRDIPVSVVALNEGK